MADLDRLFRPRSVVVVGASSDPAKIGGMVLANVRASGFGGTIHAVSRGEGIEGVDCVSAIDRLPPGIDLAFLAIPAQAVPDAVRACAAAGIGAVIIGSSGFAESGPAGQARQAEVTEIARAAGMRIVGPNCNGLYCAHVPLSIGFNTGHALAIPAGDVAIVSHSGALFDVFARRLMDFGAGLSLFVSAGNEADLDVLDYLDHCIADPATRVIALVLDGVADGVRLRRLAAAAAAAGKSIVALKIGLSDRGGAAAVAHSSRMMSDGPAYRALLDGCGIVQAGTAEGLLAAAAMLSRHGRAAGGLAVLSTSGAGGALMADLAQGAAIPMPDFLPAAQAVLDRHTLFSHAGNPIDVGVFGSFAAIDEIALAVASDPGIGLVAALMPTLAEPSREQLVAAFAAAQRMTGKPHLLIAPGGLDGTARASCDRAGVMTFTETGCALEAIHAHLQPQVVTAGGGSAEADGFEADSFEAGRAEPLALAGHGPLGEAESLDLLRRFGIPAVAAVRCDDAGAAVRTAHGLGWPVVLKGIVAGVAHKSDHGLVHLGLADEAAVRAAHAAVGGPVLIQPMLAGRLEAIAGITRAADTGPLLLAGLGGIYAEALGDAAIWSIPAPREALERRLRAHALGRILTSPRWQGADALAPLLDTLMALQRLALAGGERIAAVDVNPLLIGADGPVAVDALVVLAEPGG